MQIRPPNAATEQLNRDLDSAGTVVRHVVIDPSPSSSSSPPDHADHRRAIILAVEAELSSWTSTTDEIPDVNYLKANAMTGTPITAREFLGPNWEARRGTLLLRGHTPCYLNSYFAGDDDERDANVVPLPPHESESAGAGYAYAFTEPPYRLNLSRPDIIRLFERTVHHFLPALTDPRTTLFRWPTEWSRYFDAGHEWWGSFAWTYGTSTGPIVAVFASSTD